MKKNLTAAGTLFFLLAPLFIMGFGWFGVAPMTAFTPTGYATISATATSASAVLGSTASSAPPATMAMVTNLGAGVAYVNFSVTAASAIASPATAFPMPASSVARLAIGGAGYAAAITASGTTATVSIVTGY